MLSRKPFFAYRSFWKELDAKREFARLGVKQFCVFAGHCTNSLGEPYSPYEAIWKFRDAYDFAPWDQQMQDTLALCPDAEILCLIDINCPLWLARQIERDTYPALSNTMAFPEWQTETEKYLKAFLQYTEEHYSQHIRAYVLMCGKTDEWMDHSNCAETREKRLLFQKWCQEHGEEIPEDMPSVRQMDDSPHCNGLVRDPEKNRDALRNIRFHSDFVASSILHFAEITRSLIRPETQIGVFYGYILELGSEAGHWSHLGYEKVESSEFIDFLISPGDYQDRNMGGNSGFMTPNGTIALHHKGCLYEIDHRTHSANMQLTPYVALGWMNAWQNLAEDRAGLIREFCRTLFHGASLWWFDMWGDFYKDRENLQVIAKCREIWERCADTSFRPDAEIAMVVDPASTAYFRQQYSLHQPLHKALNRLGAPFEVYSLKDVPNIPQKIRVLLFSNVVEVTPEDAAMLRSVAQGRALYWSGCSGMSNGKIWQKQELPGTVWPENMEITPELLRETASQAGVHLYVDDACPVWAGRKLLSIHTATGGTKMIHLQYEARQATELFTGTICKVQNRTFEYDFQTPDTALFQLE